MRNKRIWKMFKLEREKLLDEMDRIQRNLDKDLTVERDFSGDY